MTNPSVQSSGSDPATTTATPSGENVNTSQPNGTDPNTEIKQQLEKAQGDLQKIRDFYAAYPDLVTFARRYTEDPKAAELVRGYINNNGQVVSKEDKVAEIEDELSGLPEPQRKAMMKLVEQKVNEVTGHLAGEVKTLREANLSTQINAWRKTFSKQEGWPVDFKDVEPKITELLQTRKAVDAEGAYKQIAAEYLLKDRADRDKTIKDLKVKVSMSRASVPQQLSVRGKGTTKTLADAWTEAVEELGIAE